MHNDKRQDSPTGSSSMRKTRMHCKKLFFLFSQIKIKQKRSFHFIGLTVLHAAHHHYAAMQLNCASTLHAASTPAGKIQQDCPKY